MMIPTSPFPAWLGKKLALLFVLVPLFVGASSLTPLDASAQRVVETQLTIAREQVSIEGRDVEAMTINGGIPGPVLRWKIGDLARIHVTNEMDVPTSVHWHGLLLPNRQDGVPGLTTPGIRPGQTHTFEIPIHHAGTYWYHSHTSLQEQRGVYGAIVIEPEPTDQERAQPFDRDVVLVLSDWTNRDPHDVLRLLKRGSEWMSIEKGTAQSLWGALRAGELGAVFRRSLIRMPPMDISDVSYDAFLTNGERDHSAFGRPGERIRLRVVNASASTYFYLGLGERPLRIVAADGLDVEPVETNRILMGIAEAYDFDLRIPDEGRLEFRATAQDGSGRTSAWFGDGAPIRAEPVPRPNLYAMRHGDHRAKHANAPEHQAHRNDAPTTPVPHETHSEQHHGAHGHAAGPAISDSHSSHTDHSMRPTTTAPKERVPPALPDPRPMPPYDLLRATSSSALDPEAPRRTIRLRLTGNMDRYVWSFDGKTLAEADLIPIRRGEVLRVELENTTMMHHPLHLHGHFFRVLTDPRDPEATPRAPLKHTVDVAPMATTTIEFLADADHDWFFHCHVLYHMKSGMSRIFHYEGSAPDPDLSEERANLFRDPWYAWANASVLSNFTDGLLSTSNTRHELAAEWEIGWQGVEDAVDHEVTGLYRYHFNRFYRVFAGGSFEEERNVGIFGAEALIPLNFDAGAWLDTRGHGRFMLGKTLSITSRLDLEAEGEYDTEQQFEGSVGARFRLTQMGSLAFEWHSEFGLGAGLELIY